MRIYLCALSWIWAPHCLDVMKNLAKKKVPWFSLVTCVLHTWLFIEVYLIFSQKSECILESIRFAITQLGPGSYKTLIKHFWPARAMQSNCQSDITVFRFSPSWESAPSTKALVGMSLGERDLSNSSLALRTTNTYQKTNTLITGHCDIVGQSEKCPLQSSFTHSIFWIK